MTNDDAVERKLMKSSNSNLYSLKYLICHSDGEYLRCYYTNFKIQNWPIHHIFTSTCVRLEKGLYSDHHWTARESSLLTSLIIIIIISLYHLIIHLRKKSSFSEFFSVWSTTCGYRQNSALTLIPLDSSLVGGLLEVTIFEISLLSNCLFVCSILNYLPLRINIVHR